MAVAIEIAGSDHGPPWYACLRQIVPSCQCIPLTASHVPHGDLARGVVQPYEIRMAVAIEIGGSDHGPPWYACLRQVGPALKRVSASASHVPDSDLPGCVVLPDQIRVKVDIEIAASELLGGSGPPADGGVIENVCVATIKIFQQQLFV